MAGEKQIPAAKTIVESYPVSPMQQGMLYESLSAPHSGVHVEQILCTLPEELNLAAFRQAWERVAARHTILRTGFRVAGLKPQQQVHRQVRLHFEQKDWRGLTKREQEGRLDAYLHAERRRGFELSVPPLMRLALFHVGETKRVLAWTFHHLLLDGRALIVLLGEVFAFYEAICQARDLDLAAPRPYRDYVEWLRTRDWSDAETFWRDQLKGFAAPTSLAVARSANQAQDPYAGHSIQQLLLSRQETARLRSVAKEHGLKLSTLFQGAWAVLLARYTGEKDVMFGVVRSCRRSSLEGAESIVGPFVNILPMRVRVTGETPALDWLKGLQRQQVAIRDHEHTPLLEVQRWSGLPVGQRLFESILNFQDPSWDAALRALGGKWARREFSIRNQPSFPLWVDVSGGPEMTLKIGYEPGRFQDAAIARMLGHFQLLLKGTAGDLSQRVADLSLPAEAERGQRLAERNRTATDFSREKCVHELFETQVERTPNAVALVYTKGEVSYRELDNQADRVAVHLRSLGVGPDPVDWLADGDLEFLGRIDHPVKICSYRIDPDQSESSLNRHPAVRESLVLAPENGG